MAGEARSPRVPSDEVYRRFAEFRSELAKRPDLTVEELRGMLLNLLEAAEMITQSLDDYERLLERMLTARRELTVA